MYLNCLFLLLGLGLRTVPRTTRSSAPEDLEGSVLYLFFFLSVLGLSEGRGKTRAGLGQNGGGFPGFCFSNLPSWRWEVEAE